MRNNKGKNMKISETKRREISQALTEMICESENAHNIECLMQGAECALSKLGYNIGISEGFDSIEVSES